MARVAGRDRRWQAELDSPRPLEIRVRLAFRERAAVRLLQWLAEENALILRARPDLPLLYESGVVYRREPVEIWSDYLNLLAQGHEDCDALAAARAGELMARGWKALQPGDGGYEEAVRRRLRSIPAEVLLRTRTTPGVPGQYHVIVRYRVGNTWYRDDPSARLGMYGNRLMGNPYGDRPESELRERAA